MNKFAEVIKPVKNFNEILKAIKNNSIVINGVTGTQKRHLAFSISEVSSRPFLFVVQNGHVYLVQLIICTNFLSYCHINLDWLS